MHSSYKNRIMKNIKYFVICMLLILMISCTGKKKDQATDTMKKDTLEVAQKMPVLRNISARVSPAIASWGAFKGFSAEIRNLRDFKGDDIFSVVDELIEKEKSLNSSGVPEKLNIASIKSRIIVLRTYILQTKAAIDDREKKEVIAAQKIKIINAYNALLKQFDEAMQGSLADEFLNKE